LIHSFSEHDFCLLIDCKDLFVFDLFLRNLVYLNK
jgi:hypothetical protein